ncbi:MAG: recombinase family protein [Oscillospiraceae bacterium]
MAGALNRKGLPTPSQAAGYEHAAACWNAQHIRRILTNSVYVGTMVYNRTGRKSYKNKTTIRRPETEWIILENHHEPLVPRELFNSLQRPARRQERRTAVSRPFSACCAAEDPEAPWFSEVGKTGGRVYLWEKPSGGRRQRQERLHTAPCAGICAI